MKVEHLIIGAGIAGLTLRHFLRSESVLVVDPAPGGYKIGESLIPELFRHPELAALLPQVQQLPSYTPKHGTTFVARGEVAYFPIGKREIGEAMHVARDELEQTLATAWNIDITRAAVQSIDWQRKRVETTAGPIDVSGLILDCSGPAMIVARSRGEIRELLPGHATWAYYDIVEQRPAALIEAARDQGWNFLRYDVRHRQVVAAESLDGAELAQTTWLAMVGDGLWAWQIPLFNGRRLSFGVVSRHGPVSPEQYRAVAEANAAPHFVLRRRGEDGPSAYDRLHTRSGFAREAEHPADKDFILLADAYGFSDPVYSVGAGVAVSQAIEVATMLNQSPGWTRERCEAYVARCRETLVRARRAFEFWYSGEVLHDPCAGAEVQDDFLLGGVFQSGISKHYGTAIELASLASERDPFEVDWEAGDVSSSLRSVLGLAGDEALAGWALLGARPCAGGLQLRWAGHELPELTVMVADDDEQATPCFRRSGPLALSYMQLFDRPYPQSPALAGLFDDLASRLSGRAEALRALMG